MTLNEKSSLLTTQDTLLALSRLSLPDKGLIDGLDASALSGREFETLSPRDGTVSGSLPRMEAVDIDLAVKSAKSAFDDGRWRTLSPSAKKQILFAWRDKLWAERDTLALLECLDTGKPITEARTVDIPLAIKTVSYYAEALDKIYGEVATTPMGRLSYTEHEPLGVVGAIVPWNFPLHMFMWKVVPALAMGNSVVLKPSELTSRSALYAAKLALEAGMPAGVFNVVTGFGHEAGAALASHGDVDMISFTGSGAVGRALMIASAQSNLKRVSLELGGKSPQIVFADCDALEAAAKAAAWGVFYNQGQVCTAASRLIVDAAIYDDFVARVVEVAKTIIPNDPFDPATTFGAMISARQAQTVKDHFDQAHADGLECLLKGGPVEVVKGGHYFAPTIFSSLKAHHRLAQEEVFGPILGIMRFESEAEAFRLANDTIYGLAAGVWTGNLSRALRATKALRAGLVWVNGWDACDITSPFGGMKQSGFGRDRSLHALYKYADLKAVSLSFEEK